MDHVNFVVASTFEEALAKLNPQDQKIGKIAAFDFQRNPAKPGFSRERVDRVKDKRFWSARVNDDIRIITHEEDARIVLCYIGRHDDAYRWAERRQYEVHPATGVAQFVEVIERTEEVIRRVEITRHAEPPLLERFGEDYLFQLGVPREWMSAVLMATDSNILAILNHLPADVQEPLLDLASGNPVRRRDSQQVAAQANTAPDPFLHPGALPHFRTVTSVDQLREALDKPRSSTSLVPDRDGVQRGIRLFQYLAESSNRGQAVGISYVGFLEYLHGNRRFAELTGRQYLPSDSGVAVRVALSITAEAGGRRPVVRDSVSINAGMDTFIWSSKRPFDRPLAAWRNYPVQPPYSREEWLAVFPAGLRRLLKASDVEIS